MLVCYYSFSDSYHSYRLIFFYMFYGSDSSLLCIFIILSYLFIHFIYLILSLLGIVCIHLSFVDGLGQPIELLSCPKPSPHAYRDTFDSSMFPSMVDVQVYWDSATSSQQEGSKQAAGAGAGVGTSPSASMLQLSGGNTGPQQQQQGAGPMSPGGSGLAARRKNGSPKIRAPGKEENDCIS